LQTDNEGIDITQVAVELSSAELTYQAALMATGKIMQTNLMNYI
jgi:flagellar hook-associated protein 3 FlgL